MALTQAQKREAERNRLYWQKREDEALKHYITDEKAYEKELKRIYKNMQDNVQNEINAFYGRYADKEDITIATAKKRVTKADIEAYERKAARYVKDKDFSAKANEEMRLYNLMMKVNRLEMLKANIGLELIAGHDELEKFMAKILKGRTEEELKRQAGILGETIRNNAKTANAIVNASFHNATFSDRVWMYQDLMRDDLDKLLQSGLIQGKNPRALAKDLQKYFVGADGNGGARFATERLMRTELARVQTEAQKQSFQRNGFGKYMFIVNAGCCPICEEISKRKTKYGTGVYLVEEMMPGKNASPIHPHCRCSTAAYEDTEEYEKWLAGLRGEEKTEEPKKVAKKATTKPKKSGITQLSLDSFSDAFKTGSEKKNTQTFIDYINNLEGADNRVLKLYNSIGKLEQFAKHGIKFSIGHGKNHALQQTYRYTGQMVEVKLTIPKLKGSNLAGQIQTTLHEQMHLLDLLFKEDQTMRGSLYTATRPNVKACFKDRDLEIGDEMKSLFKDFRNEYNTLATKYSDKFKAEHEVIKQQYLPNGTWGDGADYAGYKKAYSKIKSQIEADRDYEARNLMGGGIGNLQDIYDALSGGSHRDSMTVLYGHGSKYYRSTNSRCDEVIANYAALSVARPDLIELLRKDKPELVKALDEVIEEMGKKVDSLG